jgi:hypothetical protein
MAQSENRVEPSAGYSGTPLPKKLGIKPESAAKTDTDLTEDVVRELALANRLVDNKVCAIDATWSGLRLVIRLADR